MTGTRCYRWGHCSVFRGWLNWWSIHFNGVGICRWKLIIFKRSTSIVIHTSSLSLRAFIECKNWYSIIIWAILYCFEKMQLIFLCGYLTNSNLFAVYLLPPDISELFFQTTYTNTKFIFSIKTLVIFNSLTVKKQKIVKKKIILKNVSYILVIIKITKLVLCSTVIN